LVWDTLENPFAAVRRGSKTPRGNPSVLDAYGVNPS
jgi:hypothetical protein